MKRILLIAAVLMVLTVGIASAQDQTFDGTQAAVDTLPLVTSEPAVIEAPINIVLPDNVSVPSADGDVRLNVWQIVLGVGGLLVTGFAGGGVTFALILRGVRKDPALLAAIEGLVNSQPVERRTLIKTVGEGLKEAGELAVEAADGIPAASKPSLAA